MFCACLHARISLADYSPSIAINPTEMLSDVRRRSEDPLQFIVATRNTESFLWFVALLIWRYFFDLCRLDIDLMKSSVIMLLQLELHNQFTGPDFGAISSGVLRRLSRQEYPACPAFRPYTKSGKHELHEIWR